MGIMWYIISCNVGGLGCGWWMWLCGLCGLCSGVCYNDVYNMGGCNMGRGNMGRGNMGVWWCVIIVEI